MPRKQKSDEIEIEWQADDGYVGGARPQYTSLRASDFDADMSDEEIELAIYDAVQEDFNQRVTYGIADRDIKDAVAAIRAKLKSADAA